MSDAMHDQYGTGRTLCRQFDVDLSAYLEGEERPGIVSHAQECPSCSGVLADLRLIGSQPFEMLLEDPPARLWANIRANLEAEGLFREPAGGWHRWLPQSGMLRYAPQLGALACMTLLGTFLLLFSPTLVQVSVNPVVPPNPVTVATIASPLPTIQEAVDAMEDSFRAREKTFDPVVQATYHKGLESLDNTIRECRDSVNKEPGNTLAREYLATAYQEKAAILSGALEYDGQ